MNGQPVVPVVIVGAGPTGITAATLLARQGVHSLVLDRWDGVYPLPRAVHLDDEVHRILARLGVGEEFAAISRPCQGLRLVDAGHRVLAEFVRSEDTGVHGFPQATMFDQPELEALLRANLARHPAATVRGSVEVTAVEQDGEHARVLLTDLATGSSEVVLARYVLGCDGARSTVRSAIGATMLDLGWTEQRWLVVDVDSAVELDAWDGVHQVCDTGRAGTFMRVRGNRYRWEFRLLDGETAEDYGSLAALQPLLAPWTGHAAGDVLQVVRVAEYTFRAQVADRWRDRRVFLLGDAAHLTPPFIGQGLGAGLRDAANLAWKVAAVLDGGPDSLLATYQVERKAHATALIRRAVGVGMAMTSGGRVGDALRRVIAPRLRLIPGIGTIATESTTPRLRRAATPGRRLPRGRLAGRLSPNAALPDGRLDDLIAGRFALVTRVACPPDVRATVEASGAVVVTAPPTSALARWLRHGLATGAVVRPDGTVARAGRDLPGLAAALPRPSHALNDVLVGVA